MRTIEDTSGNTYQPPPPTTSRMGAVAQGCGGLVLTLISLPMLLIAFGFGYYLWGPGLLLIGGLVLLAGAIGLWRGQATPLVVGLVVVVVMLILAYIWRYFIFAVAVLSPLGAITDAIYGLGLMLGVMALLATVVLHAIGLFYWKRLRPPNLNRLALWAIVLVFLAALPIIVSRVEQDQRRSWLEDHRDDWLAEAETDSLIMGANTGVSLGFTFADYSGGDDTEGSSSYDVRLAELDALLETGASPIRVAASGDTLLEAEEPRLYLREDSENEADRDPEEAARRLQEQIDLEAEYMTLIAESDADLFLSDSQYSPYLLLQAQDDGDDDDDATLTWDAFAEIQAARIRYYAATYQPAAYSLVTEPSAYEQYSSLEAIDDEDEYLDLWVAQLETLIEMMGEESPETLLGVTVSLDDDFDLAFYERALEIDGIDFISLDLYQPAAFNLLEETLDERGHPRDFGKELWISETWYGFCMAPQRSMELDSMWLETVVAFAAKTNISAVMPTSFGCFLQEGGTLIVPAGDLDGRTSAWETWRELVEAWQTPLPEAG
jgi:hypothetical protein